MAKKSCWVYAAVTEEAAVSVLRMLQNHPNVSRAGITLDGMLMLGMTLEDKTQRAASRTDDHDPPEDDLLEDHVPASSPAPTKRVGAKYPLNDRQRQVFEIIREFGPIKREDIAERMNMPPRDIGNYCNALTQRALVRSDGAGVYVVTSKGTKTVRRKQKRAEIPFSAILLEEMQKTPTVRFDWEFFRSVQQSKGYALGTISSTLHKMQNQDLVANVGDGEWILTTKGRKEESNG